MDEIAAIAGQDFDLFIIAAPLAVVSWNRGHSSNTPTIGQSGKFFCNTDVNSCRSNGMPSFGALAQAAESTSAASSRGSSILMAQAETPRLGAAAAIELPLPDDSTVISYQRDAERRPFDEIFLYARALTQRVNTFSG